MTEAPKKSTGSKEFITRILTSVLFAPVLLGFYYWGGLPLSLLILILALVVLWEFYGICTTAGYQPAPTLGYLAAVVLIGGALFDLDLLLPVLIVLVLITPLWAARTAQFSPAHLASWALTIAGVLYAAGLAHYIILLRALPDGLLLGILAILGTWVADSCAYLFGKYLGRRSFFPHISPKKTWEGAIGGFLCSFVVIAVVGSLASLATTHILLIGVLVPVAVILGDLTESIFKRSAGVKDASSLLPGHGGLLDRVDGLLFAVTVVYLCSLWVF